MEQEIYSLLGICKTLKYEIRKEQNKYIALGSYMRIRHEEELRHQGELINSIEEKLSAQYRMDAEI